MSGGRPKKSPLEQRYLVTIQLFAMQDKIGWSNQQYAVKSGLTYRKLCRIRQGIQEPSLHDVIQLAEPFGLRVTLGDIDD